MLLVQTYKKVVCMGQIPMLIFVPIRTRTLMMVLTDSVQRLTRMTGLDKVQKRMQSKSLPIMFGSSAQSFPAIISGLTVAQRLTAMARLDMKRGKPHLAQGLSLLAMPHPTSKPPRTLSRVMGADCIWAWAMEMLGTQKPLGLTRGQMALPMPRLAHSYSLGCCLVQPIWVRRLYPP